MHEDKIEVDCRNILLKKLEAVKTSLGKVVDKETAKRAERIAVQSEYSTVEEAHEAFGWGSITYEEYIEVVASIEDGKKFVEETQTKNSLALEMLNDFMKILKRDAKGWEWEMLPEKEKDAIRKSSEEYREKMEARKRGEIEC